VDERRRAVVGGCVLFEPAEAELERGVSLVERVEQRALLLDLLTGAHLGQRGQPLWIDRVNAGRDGSGLAGQLPTRGFVLGVAQDAPGDRFAVDPVH
jgi:hypothetical protein